MYRLISKSLLLGLLLIMVSCSAKHTCNKLLDASQKGRFYFLLDKPSILSDYRDLMTHSPSEDTSSNESRIFIPQYFDSYEFIDDEDLGRDSVHCSFNLNFLTGTDAGRRDEIRSIFMNRDNAIQENDSIIKYTEGFYPIKLLKYSLISGGSRSLQTFICIKNKDGWKVFSSFNNPM